MLLKCLTTVLLTVFIFLSGWFMSSCHNRPDTASTTTRHIPITPVTTSNTNTPSKTFYGRMSISNKAYYYSLLETARLCQQHGTFGYARCSCYQSDAFVTLKLNTQLSQVLELKITPVGSKFGCQGRRLFPLIFEPIKNITPIERNYNNSRHSSSTKWEVQLNLKLHNAKYLLRCDNRCKLNNGSIREIDLQTLYLHPFSDITNAIGTIQQLNETRSITP